MVVGGKLLALAYSATTTVTSTAATCFASLLASGKAHRSSGQAYNSFTGFGRATATFLERPQPT